jgi:hypothetical protein
MDKQIKYPQQDTAQLGQHISNTINGTFPLPGQVEHAKEEAFAKIRAMEAEKGQAKTQGSTRAYAKQKRKRAKGRKIFFQGFAGASVAIIAFFYINISNLAVAAQVPIATHIFELLGESLEFAGDYTDLAEPVKSSGAEVESKTAGETTLTLSEVYCNGSALYLSLAIHTEGTFPDTFTDQFGKQLVDTNALVDFSFDTEGAVEWGNGGDTYIDGKMVDGHTYAGVIRFDMSQYFSGTGIEVPDNFHASLSVSKLIGEKLQNTRPELPQDLKETYEAAMKEHGLGLTDEDYQQFTEEQKEIEHQLFSEMWNAYCELYPERLEYPNEYDNWIMDGPWEFEFDVSKNSENVIRKEIGDVDERGLGILSITKTPMEISVESKLNVDYFTVILDADGNLMGGDCLGLCTVPISTYDASKVDIYICDYIEYMDELKGYWWSTDYKEKAKEKTFKQLLDERCLYHKEVTFEPNP